jgi:hypothetical protein
MTSPRSRRPRRQRSVSPFAMLYWYMLDSQGWHDLSVVARCAYVELARLYDGSNNGQLAMSARNLGARLGRSSPTAARALRELEDAGFIKVMRLGTFSRKDRLASEYRLNPFRCDVDADPPDRRWNNQKWQPHGVTHKTVRWQNHASEPSERLHSFTHDTVEPEMTPSTVSPMKHI